MLQTDAESTDIHMVAILHRPHLLYVILSLLYHKSNQMMLTAEKVTYISRENNKPLVPVKQQPISVQFAS